MSKNILIFSDGTGQAGGVRPDQNLSNVYKLYRATRVSVENKLDPADQVAFYDPGLGTQGDASGIRIRHVDQLLQALGSLAGSGITKNIIDCYEAILRFYEPGDRIFLFGFSRGAYTVRSLANVLNLCGVPTEARDGQPLPKGGRALREIADQAVRTVYEHGAGRDREEFQEEREELARRFRIAYKSEEVGSTPGSSTRGNVAPHFIGVFDTVAALGSSGGRRALLIFAIGIAALASAAFVARLAGLLFLLSFWIGFVLLLTIIVAWVASHLVRARRKKFVAGSTGPKSRTHYASWKMKFYDRFLDARTGFARHALAIDERRVDFVQVGWGHSTDVKAHDNDPIRWLKQVWFAGNHSDIGGSYPENESRLSDIALQWMVEEATAIPGPIKIDEGKLSLYPRPDGRQHCEVDSVADKLGRFANFGWTAAARSIKSDAILHPSVLARFALSEVVHCTARKLYRPEALRDHELVRHYYVGDFEQGCPVTP